MLVHAGHHFLDVLATVGPVQAKDRLLAGLHSDEDRGSAGNQLTLRLNTSLSAIARSISIVCSTANGSDASVSASTTAPVAASASARLGSQSGTTIPRTPSSMSTAEIRKGFPVPRTFVSQRQVRVSTNSSSSTRSVPGRAASALIRLG